MLQALLKRRAYKQELLVKRTSLKIGGRLRTKKKKKVPRQTKRKSPKKKTKPHKNPNSSKGPQEKVKFVRHLAGGCARTGSVLKAKEKSWGQKKESTFEKGINVGPPWNFLSRRSSFLENRSCQSLNGLKESEKGKRK